MLLPAVLFNLYLFSQLGLTIKAVVAQTDSLEFSKLPIPSSVSSSQEKESLVTHNFLEGFDRRENDVYPSRKECTDQQATNPFIIESNQDTHETGSSHRGEERLRNHARKWLNELDSI
ncbi:hypothetical protein PCASD_13168 [Puccinia coronata f. sp. avenae]|uniref:Uncharacterized protein n=1 Tax=Puccinia coronata f. sp. avenae TaxID=200324 RepID=A0A2N5U667_9BASI|nr:hypothetical protein PCASD_13168 [Puccinia coronata f. sp. avenae]